MPRQTEPNANNALGSLLQEMLPGRQVWSENTQAISGHPGLRPDIIITAPGRAAVVIVTPHTAFFSEEAVLALEERAAGEVVPVLTGQIKGA